MTAIEDHIDHDDHADRAERDQRGDRRARADRIVSAVRSVDGVIGLGTGPSAQLASTFLPGRRIVGVREQDDRVQVHIVADDVTTSLPRLADDVRRAVRSATSTDLTVDVFVDDLASRAQP